LVLFFKKELLPLRKKLTWFIALYIISFAVVVLIAAILRLAIRGA
jgi:hypothetical protein